MINAKDLRLSNLVTIQNSYRSEESGKILIIIGVGEESIQLKTTEHFSSNFGQLLKFVEPIPLTEDWLLRFGFTKLPLEKGRDSYHGRADLNFGYPVLFLDKHNYLSINCAVPNGFVFVGDIRVQCEFVHSLQNLFYCLTGKELETRP